MKLKQGYKLKTGYKLREKTKSQEQKDKPFPIYKGTKKALAKGKSKNA